MNNPLDHFLKKKISTNTKFNPITNSTFKNITQNKSKPITQFFKPMPLIKDIISKDYFTTTPRSEEMTAAQKFGGRNLKRLPKIGSGRDRDVYALGPDKVVKIAKNPKGLMQNYSERDLDYLGQVKQYEEGKDYVVMQRAQKPGPATTKTLRPLKKFSQKDFEEHKPELQEALEEAGLGGAENFDVAYGDIKAKRNWGEIEGRPVLVDAGALNIDSALSIKDEPKFVKDEWREVKSSRAVHKRKGKEDTPPDMRPGRYSPYPERLADLTTDITSKESLFVRRLPDDEEGDEETYESPYQKIKIKTGRGVSKKDYPSVDDVGYYFDNAPKEYAEAVDEINMTPKPRGKGQTTWASAHASKLSSEPNKILVYPRRKIMENIREQEARGQETNQMQQLFAHETGHIVGAGFEDDWSKKIPIETTPTEYPLRTLKEQRYFARYWDKEYKEAKKLERLQKKYGDDIPHGQGRILPSINDRASITVYRDSDYSKEALRAKEKRDDAEEKARISAAKEDVAESFAVITGPGSFSTSRKFGEVDMAPRKQFFEEQLGEDFNIRMTPREEYEELQSPEALIEEGLDPRDYHGYAGKVKSDEAYQQDYEHIKKRYTGKKYDTFGLIPDPDPDESPDRIIRLVGRLKNEPKVQEVQARVDDILNEPGFEPLQERILYKSDYQKRRNFKPYTKKKKIDQDDSPNDWVEPYGFENGEDVEYKSRKIVKIPTKRLYYMRGRGNMPDNKKIIMDPDAYYTGAIKNKEELYREAERHKAMEERFGNKVSLSKPRKEHLPFIGTRTFIEAHKHEQPVMHKMKVRNVMQPSSSSDLVHQKTYEDPEEYLAEMTKTLKSEEKSVPMLELSIRDLRRGVTGEGRHRILAAKKAGYEYVPVVVDDTPEVDKIIAEKKYEYKEKEPVTPSSPELLSTLDKIETPEEKLDRRIFRR